MARCWDSTCGHDWRALLEWDALVRRATHGDVAAAEAIASRVRPGIRAYLNRFGIGQHELVESCSSELVAAVRAGAVTSIEELPQHLRQIVSRATQRHMDATVNDLLG